MLSRLLPVNSQRRMMLRVVRSVLKEPGSMLGRMHPDNARNFIRYAAKTFSCPICGTQDKPLYDFPDVNLRREHHVGVLRETLQCRGCFSAMRQRVLAVTLIRWVNARHQTHSSTIEDLRAGGLGTLRLLDTDSFSAISARLKALPTVTRCSYLPDRAWGQEISPGYFNIDLQRMDFPDNAFDIILSSDVMEHVRDCNAAHHEIFRVLKPGGAYIFTVPFEKSSDRNIRLVDVQDGNDVFLCKPHIHGDPLSGGIVAYRVFGWELLSDLRSIGFEAEFHDVEDEASLITQGDVIVACKPDS